MQTTPHSVTLATDNNPRSIQPIASKSDKSDQQERPVTESELRAASTKAIQLIQRAQVVWSKKETCASCHHQLLPEKMSKMARERGVPFDETIARDTTAATFSFMKDLDGAVQRYD